MATLNYIAVNSEIDLSTHDDLREAVLRDVERAVRSRTLKTDTSPVSAIDGDAALVDLSLKANEVWTVVIDATDGTFTLDYDGTETANIDFDALPSAVEAALAAIPALAGNVVVGGAAGSYVLEFVGTTAVIGIPGEVATLADGASTALTGGAATNTVTQVIAIGTEQA